MAKIFQHPSPRYEETPPPPTPAPTSAPAPAPAPPPVVAVSRVPTPTPSEPSPEQAAEPAYTRRDRGLVGTVATSWRGVLLPGAAAPPRKRLLGE